MPPILTPEEWQKRKAAYEAFNRWDEEQANFPDLHAAIAWWWDLLCLYRKLHPDDPLIDPDKYENLAQVRRALSLLR